MQFLSVTRLYTTRGDVEDRQPFSWILPCIMVAVGAHSSFLMLVSVLHGFVLAEIAFFAYTGPYEWTCDVCRHAGEGVG